MAYCPSCGTDVPDGARYCASCGTALTTEPAPRDPPRAQAVVNKRENPLTGGMKAGATGCVGCVTFAILALIVIGLLVHH